MILTDISIRRPVFATVSILALVLLGVVSYFNLNIDEYPDVQMPIITVSVIYSGATPEQVDTQVVKKIEEAVNTVAGVKHISSSSKTGVAETVIEFTLNTPPAVAAQDVRDKISAIRDELPQSIEAPVIVRFDPKAAPIISAAVISTGGMSIRELTEMVNDVIKPRLENVNGVGRIKISGEEKRQVLLKLNIDKMVAYGLAVPEVIQCLKAENMDVPSGKITGNNQEIALHTAGNLTAVEDFLLLPVSNKDKVSIYLDDIALVEDGIRDVDSIVHYEGVQAVGIEVSKQSGANTVKLADEVKRVLLQINAELPAGVKLQLVRDDSQRIRNAVDDVMLNLVVGGLFAVLIVWLFLGDWRSTFISAIAIPTSIIATFFIMKVLGFSLNVMSLLGLSLAVGLLIDDAIVVIENISRHVAMGKDKITAVVDGTEEIGLAVTATTFTLVAVFVPVGFMTGVIGQFFKEFGITVAFAVLISLLIAFTLTPLMASKYLHSGQGMANGAVSWWRRKWEVLVDAFIELYTKILASLLNKRGKVITGALLLFIMAVLIMPLLGESFLPLGDQGEFSIKAKVEPGMSIEGAGLLSGRMEEVLQGVPEIKALYSRVDSDEISLFVKLSPKRQRTQQQIIIAARERLSSIPGVKPSFVQWNGIDEDKPVTMVIRGESPEVLEQLAIQMQREMEKMNGTKDIISSNRPGRPDLKVTILRERASDLGISTANISDTLQALFNGIIVGYYQDQDERIEVKARLDEHERSTANLAKVYLTSTKEGANYIPLSQVTSTDYTTVNSEIKRYDRKKEIRITANLEGTSQGEFKQALDDKLEEIKLPKGYNISLVGDSENMDESSAGMISAMILAVAFIFFILAAQFESYIDPFSIMMTLPLAIIGGILGLFVTGSDLNIMSQIGMIMLMGLVTKNAILLVDFTKQRMAEGVECHEALVDAARVRVRPIVMTSAAMIFGMLPLALALGPGAESRASMAHAIIGGVISSTLLTLIVVPVVYSFLYDLKSYNYVKNAFIQRLSKSDET